MATKYNYWFWENVFSEQEIKQIVYDVDQNYDKIEPEKLGATDSQGHSKKNLHCKQISYYKIKSKLDNVLDRAYAINSHEFGYNLYPKNDHDVINLNVYNENQKANYDWHIDECRSETHDIKLTVLINCSTEYYEGGIFQIFHNEEFEIPEFNKPGSMIMFKSYMNHRVTPVTKGERRSLAFFLKGPSFQ